MIETVRYEFDGYRWVPVARAYVAECGHVHWEPVRPFDLRATLRMLKYEPDGGPCWRGDDLAARGIP